MNLTHLTVHHFQGIPSFDGALTPLVLFAGDNAAGKTSLLQAIRFALTGDINRVALKKDYPLVVHEGARKAMVRLSLSAGGTEDTIEATLPAGKHYVTVEPGSAAALALDPPAFMRLKADERRTLLYDLAGDMGDVVELARKRMVEAVIPPPMMDAILPSLRAGFPEAHTQAMQRASEARGAWRGVTGEAYGVQKADGWRPDCPVKAPSAEDRSLVEETLEQSQAALADAHERAGALKASLTDEQRTELEAEAAKLAEFTERIATGNSKIEDWRKRRTELAQIAEQASGVCFECPECEAKLRYSGGQVSVRPEEAPDAGNVSAEILDLGRKIDSGQQQLGMLQASQRKAQAARDRLDAAAPAGDTDDEVRQAIADAQDAVDSTRRTLADYDARDAMVREAADKAKRAAKHHAEAKLWADVAAIMAPDGLPAELLGWALKPVNDALQNGPVGWPIVQLRGDMTLTVGGRPYGLCSESEQWRADLLMAAWLARRSGSYVIVADRMDVLDPASRLPLLDWLDRQGADHGLQAILAATLKGPPALDFATVYWIGGDAVEAQAA